MGVVRDVTVEQLTQAIGGIDTSGLAKDTTLQATNTALGNINTTLGGITTNDPPTDTTQQSIASAISGLGATLGSDRALIDGSNIVSPATFRANIGAITSVSTSNGDFVNLVSNNEVWLVVVTRLTTSQSCIVIASMLNSTISVTEIFKSSSFSVVYNQGTLSFKYNNSGTGVFGGAIKLN